MSVERIKYFSLAMIILYSLSCSNEHEIEEGTTESAVTTSSTNNTSGAIKSGVNEYLYLQNSQIEVIPDESEVDPAILEQDADEDESLENEIEPNTSGQSNSQGEEQDSAEGEEDSAEGEEDSAEGEDQDSAEEEEQDSAMQAAEEEDEELEYKDKEEEQESKFYSEEEKEGADDESSSQESTDSEEFSDASHKGKGKKGSKPFAEEDPSTESDDNEAFVLDTTHATAVRIDPKRNRAIFKLKKIDEFEPGIYKISAKWKKSEFADKLSTKRLSVIQRKKKDSKFCEQLVENPEADEDWNAIGVFYLSKKARVVIKNKKNSLFRVSSSLKFEQLDQDSEINKKKKWKCLHGQVRGFNLQQP